MPDAARYQYLNQEFKAYMNGLGASEVIQIETIIQNALGVKNRSNVGHWWRETATPRNFLNTKISSEDQERRIALIEAITGIRPNNKPQKIVEREGRPDVIGRKLKEYLNLDHYQRTATGLVLTAAGFETSYAIDSDDEPDLVSDEDSDEFSDILEP